MSLRLVLGTTLAALTGAGAALAQPAAALPDLTIAIRTIEPGTRGSVTAEISNIGGAASGTTRVRVLVAGGDGAMDVTLYPLLPGGTATAVIRGTFHPGEGVQAVVDPDRAVREADETNNLSAVTLVSEAFTPIVPDTLTLPMP